MRICCQVISGCHGPCTVAVGQRMVAHAAGSLEHTGTQAVAHLGASAQTGTREHEAKVGLGRGRHVSTPQRSGPCDRTSADAPGPTRRYDSCG